MSQQKSIDFHRLKDYKNSPLMLTTLSKEVALMEESGAELASGRITSFLMRYGIWISVQTPSMDDIRSMLKAIA